MRDRIKAKMPMIGAAAALTLALSACGGGASGLSEQQDALDALSDFEDALSEVEDEDDFEALDREFDDFGDALECFQEALAEDAEATGELVPQVSGAGDPVAGVAEPNSDC